MRIIVIFIFSLFSPIVLLSQKTMRVPPGTVKVNDSLYVDETEVANVHWREWLQAYLLNTKKDTASYNRFLPDTLVWENDRNFSLHKSYFRHPSFNMYPVVGISYEQAIEYCKWRTYMANLNLYLKRKKKKYLNPDSSYKFPIHFIYRLPTVEEWEQIAKSGIDSNTKSFKKWKNHAAIFFHTKEAFERADSINNEITPSPVKTYFQNKYGVYNVIGNVAELTSTRGIAKGGSFFHSLHESNYIQQQTYSKPEKWLGFRCVAVIVK